MWLVRSKRRKGRSLAKHQRKEEEEEEKMANIQQAKEGGQDIPPHGQHSLLYPATDCNPFTGNMTLFLIISSTPRMDRSKYRGGKLIITFQAEKKLKGDPGLQRANRKYQSSLNRALDVLLRASHFCFRALTQARSSIVRGTAACRSCCWCSFGNNEHDGSSWDVPEEGSVVNACGDVSGDCNCGCIANGDLEFRGGGCDGGPSAL